MRRGPRNVTETVVLAAARRRSRASTAVTTRRTVDAGSGKGRP